MGKSENVQINFIDLLVEAIVYNNKVKFKIEEVFNKNKQYYLELMKEYQNDIDKYCIYSLRQDDIVRKFLSILYSAIYKNNENDINNAFDIIKYGWPYAYQYVEMNKIIDFDDFIKKFNKKFKTFDNNQLNSNMFIVLFLTMQTNKEIKECETYKFLNELLIAYASEKSLKFNKKKFLQTNRDIILKIRQKFLSYINIKNFNVDNLINNSKIKRYYDITSFIFDVENIDNYIIYDVNITENDIDDLIITYILTNGQGNLDSLLSIINYEDLIQYICKNLPTKVFIKAFKLAKDYYNQNNQDLFLYDLLKLNNELNLEKHKNEELQDQLNKLNELIKEKETQIRKLESQLEELNEYKKEIVALRNYIFEMNNLDVTEETINKELPTINNKDILIVGGHKWIEKIKEYIPNAIIITDDTINFDVKILNNIKYIFIYTKHLSHALYYKIISNIKNKNVELYFLPYQNIEKNIEIIIQKIASNN